MQSNIPTAQFNSRDEMMRAAMMNSVSPDQCHPTPPPTNAELRALFLDEVRRLVCADRNVTHGDAEDNFRVIASLWNVYLHNSPGENCHDLTNKDVAIMMCLFKISRLMTNVNNMENWLDLAGYAACGGGIVKKNN